MIPEPANDPQIVQQMIPPGLELISTQKWRGLYEKSTDGYIFLELS